MPDLSNLRREYLSGKLDIDMLDNNPYIQFRNWVDNAIRAGIPDATAMALSTATADGKPSSRIVLLKDVEADGLVFFTNYESRKALQIRENPYGALLFFWPDLERQIRVEGKITRVPSEKSDEYYYSRPQGGRIGAWASPQSKKIPGREYLEKLQEDYTSLFKSKELPRPAVWGGYKLHAKLFEFWQGRENRLHDRFEYSLKGHMWEIHRLAP